MSRFFAQHITTDSPSVTIDDLSEVHHLTHVLRLKEGAGVEVINGQGALVSGVIERISKTQVNVRVEKRQVASVDDRVRVTLACAVPKKAKFETILEKCTELGVDEIIPMVTERTEGVAKGPGKRDDRFFRVILNAAKQSKRLFFPILHPAMKFDAVLGAFVTPQTAVIIPWLEGDRLSLKSALQKNPSAKSILILIGPEGDFSSLEAARAMALGALPVSLGETVLKVDTAAIAAVSFVRLNYASNL